MTARVHMRRHGNGLHVAAIDIPTTCGALRVSGVGSWFSDALSTASSVANRIASDPVMSSILPPQATMALKAVNALSSAAQQGAPALRRAMSTFSGPGKQRLARVLHREAVKRDAVDPVRPQMRERPEDHEDYEYDRGDDGADQGDDGGGDNSRDHRATADAIEGEE